MPCGPLNSVIPRCYGDVAGSATSFCFLRLGMKCEVCPKQFGIGSALMGFWRNEFSEQEIALVLDKVKGFREISDDGKVTLKSIGNSDGFTAILVSALGIQVATDALKTRIIRAVLFSPDLPQQFSEREFKAVTYRLSQKFQTEDMKLYRVVFPIWNKPDFLGGLRKNSDVTLNFSPSSKTRLFKRILRERKSQTENRYYEKFFTSDRLSDLAKCQICVGSVRANNPTDANERASEALYEVLGLLNLARDGGKYWRSSSRVEGKLPVSDTLIGPHTTTHTEKGELTHDGFWHEEWVGGPNKPNLKPLALRNWERRFEQLVNGCSTSAWKMECKSAAARYFKSFSNPNLEESFLEGWRLFENISGSRFEKIDDKLRRASNIFEENLEYLVVGRHLALRRNLLAHGHAIRSGDDETLAFQMLQFVAPFLQRFILNSFSFASPKEFWEFLDLPASKQERLSERCALQRRLELLQKAAEFREERDWPDT